MPPKRSTNVDRTVVNIKINENDDIELLEADDDDFEEEENITKYVVENIKCEDGNEDVVIKKNSKEDDELEDIEEEDDDYDESEDIKQLEITEHVCAKCSNVFTSIKGLKKHLPFCRYTSEAGQRIAEMAKHIDKIERESEFMAKQNICFCCEENFDTCHSGHISCAHCPKSFKTQVSLERHLFLVHASEDNFQCLICNATCASKKILNLHTEQHMSRGKPFACKECGKEFTRRYHVLRHKKHSKCGQTEDSQLSCHVCGKKFNRVDNLRGHLRQHVNGPAAKKNEFECPYCQRLFNTSSVLNVHIRTHTGERPFPCDLCEKSFPSNVSLKKHRRYHTGERPYSCTLCTSAFAAKEVLNRHMKRHTGERPHVCTECGKSFIQATQLKCHLKTHARDFACASCEEKFKTQKQLEKHVAKEHNNKRTQRLLATNSIGTTVVNIDIPLFECKYCFKSFKTKVSYTKHMEMEAAKHASDAGEGETSPTKKTEFACTYCPKKFKVEDNFKRHMALEKKRQRSLKCDTCEMAFNSHDCLDFHVLKVHDKGQDNNICGICDRSFSTRAILITHLEIKHRALLADVLPSTQPEPSNTVQVQKIELKDETDDKSEGVLIEEYVIEDVEEEKLSEKPDLRPKRKRGITDYFSPKPTKAKHEIVEKEEPPKNVEEKVVNKIEEVKCVDEECSITKDVGNLLNLLVDSTTLGKFGWPEASVEAVIRKVIENCGHSMDDCNMSNDYETRMQEYVKLLFSVVVDNDSIRELLNNYPIEEVIQQVLTLSED